MPRRFKRSASAHEQKEAAHNLGVEASRRFGQAVFDKLDQWLAVFNSEQQAKLKEVAQRRIDKQVATWHAAEGTVTAWGGPSGLGAELLAGNEALIPAYPELASSLVRSSITIHREKVQEKRLRDVVAKVPAPETELFQSQAKQGNLSSAEYYKKLAKLQQENRKQLVEETRQQIEELLTPQQLSALADFNLHKEMVRALSVRQGYSQEN